MINIEEINPKVIEFVKEMNMVCQSQEIKTIDDIREKIVITIANIQEACQEE